MFINRNTRNIMSFCSTVKTIDHVKTFVKPGVQPGQCRQECVYAIGSLVWF